MSVLTFPTAPQAPPTDGIPAILNGFTRLLADMQVQQRRLQACEFSPDLRNAMLLDLATSSLRLFDANIKYLNEVKRGLPGEAEAV